jgi:two-component system CitB family sensor kinase
VPALAREVALPHTPGLLRVQSRLFLTTLGAFLVLGLPLAGVVSRGVYQGIYQSFAERSLRESTLMATLPLVRVALEGTSSERADLNSLLNQYRAQLGADYIVITDRAARRLTHPNPVEIGKKMQGGDFTAFLRGQSVTETVQGTLGRSVRSKVSVLNAEGRVVGLASVGFLLPRLRDVFLEVLRAGLPWYLGMLGLALLLSLLVARRVQAEMLGLEPEQIAGGLQQYRTVLNTLEEGVLVTRAGQVFVMNPQARALLGTPDAALPIAWPPELQLPEPGHRLTIELQGCPVLLTAQDAGEGALVVTIRDLARVRALADELTQSQRYAELLRAQTHEFTNRLHTLAGLLYLGETHEALRLIHTQAERHTAHAQAVRGLRHLRLSALLLGKYDRAAELGVQLTLDPLSFLPAALPAGVLDLLELAAGNLIENALEAACLPGATGAEVCVLIAADPEGLILEVRDTGPGVLPELAGAIMMRGVSSKGTGTNGQGRGVGLSLVVTRAQSLGATLTHDRVQVGQQTWTRFTLDLPLPEEVST